MKKIKLGFLLLVFCLFLTGCGCSKEKFNVTFDTKGGSEVATQEVEKNETATKPTDPTKESYTFKGWYLDLAKDEEFDFNTAITKDITLYAKWEEVVKEWTITLDSNGGNKLATLKVKDGSKLGTLPKPTREGYTFDGWYLKDKKVSVNTVVTGDMVLVAKWNQDAGTTPVEPSKPVVQKYTVKFDNGDVVEVLKGEKVEAPVEPTKEGYTFLGWYLNDVKFDFNTAITKNITLTAKWKVNEYTVTFVDNEKTTKVTVNYGEKVEELEASVLEGYVFDGWFLNNEKYDFTKEVTGDITLEAKYLRNISRSLEETSTNFISNYYNKIYGGTTGKEITPESPEFKNELVYVEVGEVKSTEVPTEITIGANVYDNTDSKISIGNNAFIKAPLWKVENGKVYVSVAVLAVDASPYGKTAITVGGEDILVYAFEDSSANKLEIAEVKGLFGQGKYTNDATFSGNKITYVTGNAAQGVGIKLNLVKGEDVTPVANTVVFRKNLKNNTFGLTKEDVEGYAYATYVFAYANKTFDTETKANLNYKLAVPGAGAITIEIDATGITETFSNVASIMTSTSSAFKNTFYNKYNSETIDALDETQEDAYYVDLGEYVGTEAPTSLTIESTNYTNEAVKVSIGKNAFVNVPLWKISEDNHVLVALPLLAVEALPVGATTVTVGGQTMRVVAYTDDVSANKLAIVSVDGFGSVGADHLNEATFDGNIVTYRSSHNAQGLGINLGYVNNDGTTTKLNLTENDLIFRKDNSNGTIGVTTIDGEFTYALYALGYKNEAFTEIKAVTRDYKLAIAGVGSINVVVNAESVILGK